MNAVDWLRNRQEQQELTYWLAFFGYDPRDRSWANRIYLLYLVLFFTIWIFMTLSLLAVGGAKILHFLDPLSPTRAAIQIGWISITVWYVLTILQVLKRSPVIFSEQDALLLCQMPVDHRYLVIRWMRMPWLKSAIPFWAAAITIGFSAAELDLPEATSLFDYLNYAWFGLRAWIVIIPIHLSLYATQWIAGVARLQRDGGYRWPGYLFLIGTLVFSVFLVVTFTDGRLDLPGIGSMLAGALAFPDEIYQISNYLLPILLTGWVMAGFFILILFRSSVSFNLSRAAQETILVEKLYSARKYGFTSFADELETQSRLRQPRVSLLKPIIPGTGVIIWKEGIQVQRTLKPSSIIVWLYILLLMLSLPFAPDLFSRMFIIAIWAIQVGQVSVIRLRDDLSHYILVRQLPIGRKKMLIVELSSAYLAAIIFSALGLIAGDYIGGTSVDGFLYLLPGTITGITSLSAAGIIRRSKSDHLFNENVPGISETWFFLGLVFALIPVGFWYFLARPLGMIAATLVSIGLGLLSIKLAENSFRYIDRN